MTDDIIQHYTRQLLYKIHVYNFKCKRKADIYNVKSAPVVVCRWLSNQAMLVFFWSHTNATTRQQI